MNKYEYFKNLLTQKESANQQWEEELINSVEEIENHLTFALFGESSDDNRRYVGVSESHSDYKIPSSFNFYCNNGQLELEVTIEISHSSVFRYPLLLRNPAGKGVIFSMNGNHWGYVEDYSNQVLTKIEQELTLTNYDL